MPNELCVSKNRLEGSLAEAPLASLLAPCKAHLVTGTITVRVDGQTAVLQLRAGAVDDATFGDAEGHDAVRRLEALDHGEYELVQRLPDLSGALGSSASLEGEIGDVPLVAIMRHCEENALSCTITVVGGFDRGEIVYRAGEPERVLLNGVRDDDAIVAILGWKEARFRIAAPPLDLRISGWPTVTREPTVPFRVRARGTQPPAPAPTVVAPATATAPRRSRSRLAVLAALFVLAAATTCFAQYLAYR